MKRKDWNTPIAGSEELTPWFFLKPYLGLQPAPNGWPQVIHGNHHISLHSDAQGNEDFPILDTVFSSNRDKNIHKQSLIWYNCTGKGTCWPRPGPKNHFLSWAKSGGAQPVPTGSATGWRGLVPGPLSPSHPAFQINQSPVPILQVSSSNTSYPDVPAFP